VSIVLLANIITIHEKVVQLVTKETGRAAACRAKTSLQSQEPDSLYLSDAKLRALLDGPIRTAFGVEIAPKNLKRMMNGLNPTVGDLSIAIFTCLRRQHGPLRKKITAATRAALDPTMVGR